MSAIEELFGTPDVFARRVFRDAAEAITMERDALLPSERFTARTESLRDPDVLFGRLGRSYREEVREYFGLGTDSSPGSMSPSRQRSRESDARAAECRSTIEQLNSRLDAVRRLYEFDGEGAEELRSDFVDGFLSLRSAQVAMNSHERDEASWATAPAESAREPVIEEREPQDGLTLLRLAFDACVREGKLKEAGVSWNSWRAEYLARQ